MADITRKPNILFIMADQFRGDIMSCVGGEAKTPALDQLAREGVLFRECCTVSPLCVPARISMMTGLYPHTTCVWNNVDFVLSPEAQLWTKILKQDGYSTAVFGKLHLHTDFGDMIKREYLVHGYGFETVNEVSGPHSTCQTRTHMSEEWKEKGIWDLFCQDMLSRTKEPYALPSPLSVEDYYDTYVGRKAKEYLMGYNNTKPWFCHVSFPGPHEPWDAPLPYSEMYQCSGMREPLPEVYESVLPRVKGEYDNLKQNAKIHCNLEQSRKIQANYCGSVSLIDKLIGDIIDTVKKRGEWNNTVIIFTSDHGELNGDHGLIHKRTFFRPVLNVPLIVRTPETKNLNNHISDTLISNLDVGPTIIDLAGGKIDYEQFGKSFFPIISDTSIEHRDCIISEYNGELMYYDKMWKMVINKSGEPYLLFNVLDDPMEVINLAALPEYKGKTIELKNRLLEMVVNNSKLTPEIIQIPFIPDEKEFQRCIEPERYG